MGKVTKAAPSYRPKSAHLKKSGYILARAKEACLHFDNLRVLEAEAFRKRGRTSDEEQDLLRAMLVFACAGLDAVLKQIIKDTLTSLAEVNSEVLASVQKFAKRRAVEPEFIAGALLSEKPQQYILNLFVRDLIAGSLQSYEELRKVAECLGFNAVLSRFNETQARDALKARNEIIHEMDVKFTQWKRRKDPAPRIKSGHRPRKINDMRLYTETILKVAEEFLKEADHQLSPTPLNKHA